jgi:hypothetical protein
VTTVAVDQAAARGLLVLSAAGNAGPGFRTLVTPADATPLAIGAEDSLAPSRRSPPWPDRRRAAQPDLTAPGRVCVLVGGGAVRRGRHVVRDPS